MIKKIRDVIDYLNGATDHSEVLPLPVDSPLWGVFWAILLVLILAFSGQSSKFIYIDF